MSATTQPESLNIREIEQTYEDGTWLLTDADLTAVLETRHWREPHPGAGFWWRRKQLIDQLAYREYLSKKGGAA